MTEEKFDIKWFHLVEDENSTAPTGIKIVGNENETPLEKQSKFRFKDKTAADDATLSSLIVSREIANEDNPEEKETKTYEFDEDKTFDPEILEYSITILEYIDTLDITAIPTDEEAKMKIKVPKRDEETGELIYEDENKTIIVYEEKEIEKGIPFEAVLNKLGELDTELTIIVTAADGETTKEYKLIIKRPYGTIKGKTILSDFDDEYLAEEIFNIYEVELNHRSDINIYQADLIEWESIPDLYALEYENPTTYDDVEAAKKEATFSTENDGTFEIYVIPGKYDIQVTRLAYLDYIYSDVVVNPGDEIDMGEFRRLAGDANRDGVISQEDVTTTKQAMDMEKEDPDFTEAYNPMQTGVVTMEDLTYVKSNQDNELTIEYFGI